MHAQNHCRRSRNFRVYHFCHKNRIWINFARKYCLCCLIVRQISIHTMNINKLCYLCNTSSISIIAENARFDSFHSASSFVFGKILNDWKKRIYYLCAKYFWENGARLKCKWSVAQIKVLILKKNNSSSTLF